LDCGATTITEEMKLACVREIADLAKAETSDEVAAAYAGEELVFGPDYLIPKPFDSRLILRIAPAVAAAAEASGVATRPIKDMALYRQSLQRFIYQTGILMQPVFDAATSTKPENKRIAIADGEEERALRACQQAIDEQLAAPILVGRPAVIEARILKAGLRMRIGQDVEVVNPEDDPRYRSYWEHYQAIMGRHGVTPEMAKAAVRRSNTLIAALMVSRGDADGMLCGLVGTFDTHLSRIDDVLGKAKGASTYGTCNALVLGERTLFIADTYVNEEPSAQQLAEIAAMTVAEVQRFGIPPKVAFLSHSSFGSSQSASAKKMRLARDLFVASNPDVPCDGEMHGDAAMSEAVRKSYLPGTTLEGSANVLVCPNLDSANILFNVLKMTSSDGVTVGPVLMGSSAPVHIMNPSATVRRLVNMIALAAANAGVRKS